MNERLDVRANERVSGPSWKAIRPQFDRINDILLAVSPTAHGVLTTIYIKYVDESKAGSQPYAVVWVKRSSELVVGLALPETIQSSGLEKEIRGYKYANLSGFFIANANHAVPAALEEWARQAYEHTKGQFKESQGS